MQSLQEKVDLLKLDFTATENDEVKFKQAYFNTLKFVQLVYTEESSQYIGIHDAISAYDAVTKDAAARQTLKDNCIDVLNVLTFSKKN